MRMTRRTAIIHMSLLIALTMTRAELSLAEDWPGFRGPGRQGISQEKNIPLEWSETSNIAWKTPVPGEGWSSPIVFEDRVFVTTATEEGTSFRLIRLDRKNGAVLWNKEVFRQKAGHKQRFNSYASSTPVTDGQKVFVVGADGSIAAVSNEGNVAWTNRDVEFYSEHGLAVSPVLYKDLLIVPFDGSSSGPDPKLGWQKPWDRAVIMAIEKNTGKVRWKGKRGLSCVAHVSPQILREDGRDQLVSSAGNVVQGFDLETGHRIWTASSPGEGVVPSVVIGEGLVFTASGFGESTIRVVRTGGEGDVTDTHIAWESTEDVPRVPSMLYVRPWLFLVTETGVAKCLRAATGQVIWRQRLDPKYSASPVWAQGRIYLLSEKGTTTVIEAEPEFNVLAQNELNEKCCASPAISQKQIFIRSERNLYCIGEN
ncbi:MAG: PQQ-binding-like beta-propeller repeat protein [Phycisphaerales bacterium]|nr:MAG: PQQ-binding-like beta-propeller repeat protein [Phycisphaerales bacterium]